MKAKYIKQLRNEIHHYRMYRLYRNVAPTDILQNELDKHQYDIIYGRNEMDAVKRYCRKNPALYFHTHWLSQARWYGGDLMILEVGKTYNHRIYLDW